MKKISLIVLVTMGFVASAIAPNVFGFKSVFAGPVANMVISEQPSNSFVLRNVTVFDGDTAHEGVDILVRDGVIEFGEVISHDHGFPEFSMEGHTVLPAFIDSHTHNSFPNSTGARSDALRFGVGTHLDMLGDPSIIADARADRAEIRQVSQADMWSAGRLVSIGSLREGSTDHVVATRIAEGSDFIKMTIFSGEVFNRDVQTLNHEQISQLVVAAHALGRMAVAHVLTIGEARLAIGAGVDGLVHLFGDERVTPEFIDLLREHGQFVISTVSYLETGYSRDVPILADPRIAERLSSRQRQSLELRTRSPDDPIFVDGVFQYIRSNLRALVDAGVPVLIGTDMPNPGTAAGVSVHHELELFVEAGISPLTALRSATALPAEVFGLHDRGRIQTGMRADLVMVKGNPMEDITATRNIVAVWKNGYAIELD